MSGKTTRKWLAAVSRAFIIKNLKINDNFRHFPVGNVDFRGLAMDFSRGKHQSHQPFIGEEER
ncbi:hypothetical protein E2320_001359 [Naja naja]|nr:hypothetical protein E2320_001359 [Naja naja]